MLRVRKRAVQPVQPRNLPELEQVLVQEWRNIPQRFLRNYVMSMRQRCMKVIQAQGGHIVYLLFNIMFYLFCDKSCD